MVMECLIEWAKRLSSVAVLLMLVSCAPVMVPVGDVGTTPPPSPQPKPDPRPPVRPIEPSRDQVTPASAAVLKLLDEGWQLHHNGEYDRSNAVAERALRLDRAEPKVFLLLASNYFSMLQLTLAEQLARQGIPLATDDRNTRARLQSLLNQILSAN